MSVLTVSENHSNFMALPPEIGRHNSEREMIAQH